MSTWGIGINDVSDETQALKDKLGSKDAQIAAQQAQLMKKAIELEELKSALNETLQKLSHESDRALQLEAEASQRCEDLRNAKNAAQNVQAVLDSANERIKAGEMETGNLQELLERVSYTSDEHLAHGTRLEREKSTLEARVRELDAIIQETKNSAAAPTGGRIFSRPRSSSVSNTEVAVLEQELCDVRARLAGRETELQVVVQRHSQIQDQLMKTDNEKLAMERKMTEQLANLTSLLEEKEEELRYMRISQGDASREEELLKRIEEDDAKITALESMLKETPDVCAAKDRLRRIERQLEHQIQQTKEYEEREIEAVRQKEEALDELDIMRKQVQGLITVGEEKEIAVRSLSDRIHDADFPASIPENASDPLADDAQLVYIERLLNAIERLRGERDTLRRNINFLESESRFTIDALEAKLLASSDVDMSVEVAKSAASLHQSRAQMERPCTHTHDMNELKEQGIKRLQLAAAASIVLIGHMDSGSEELRREVVERRRAHAEAEMKLEATMSSLDELGVKLKEKEAEFETTTLCLEATASQRDDLLSQLRGNSMLGLQTDEEHCAHQETRTYLAQIESQLNEASQRIEDVESERDSLNLQVKNLMVDLEGAQQDLARAERRYTTLQFHQLSAMSDNEATRQLRQQIEELELRVMRRTEQIGIHQHDIRRLETNLRLQEERLTEMTNDLETLAAQKDAMVEDCADAREARDQAISRVEQLEVHIEILEARAEESDCAVETMVDVIMQNVGRSRTAAHLAHEKTEHLKAEYARVDSAHQAAMRILEEQSSGLADDASGSHAAYRMIQEITIALSISQLALSKARGSVTALGRDKCRLEQVVADLQGQMELRVSEMRGLDQQLGDLRQKSSEREAESITHSLELEQQIQILRDTGADLEAAHHLAINDLLVAKGGLENRLAEVEGLLNKTEPEGEVSRLMSQHAGEMNRVRGQLNEKTHALEELQITYTASQKEHDQSLSQSAILIDALEGRLATATKRLEQSELLNSELSRLCQEHEDTLSRLKLDLNTALQGVQTAKASQQEQETLYLHALDELKIVKEEYTQGLARLIQESATSRNQLEKESRELQDRIAHQSKDLDSLNRELKNLQTQLDESLVARGRDREEHIRAIELVHDQQELSECALTQLKQASGLVQERLDQTRLDLKTMETEKSAFQEQVTELSAENQRSIALHRFLKGQIAEGQEAIDVLKKELATTRAELTRMEMIGKTAETNLNLQSAQHKREMMDLHRELASLRSRPDHEGSLKELLERNNEMEELLRAKCAEIEANDDRVLEMMKDNKKLSTKVESLSRKVANLQTKLTAAKASVQIANVSPPPLTNDQPHAHSTSVPTVHPIPIFSNHIYSPTNDNPKSRAVSGPLARPKTPERGHPPPVFKARTPAKRIVPSTFEVDSIPSTSSIGKKRRAPDDFEDYDSLPPQAFTAESVPGDRMESTTPRARRVLSSIHSGFTPKRGQASRPMASPKRAVTTGSARASPVIADVTNSPRSASQSAKSSKRSWLGKIRGVSTQTTGRQTLSRPLFERGKDS